MIGVVCEILNPHSLIISTISRYLKIYFKYHLTVSRMIADSYCFHRRACNLDTTNAYAVPIKDIHLPLKKHFRKILQNLKASSQNIYQNK
jgi:hypothetical protein